MLRWVPCSLIQYTLTERLSTSLRVYLILNISSDGYIKRNSALFELISSMSLIKSRKTIDKHLSKLVALNWLGYNKGTYYVHGISSISPNPNTYRVEFCQAYLREWRPYLYGAFIGQLANQQKIRVRAEIRHLRNNKQGVPNRRIRQTDSYPISLQSIQQILKVSVRTAYQYKHSAEACGFISTTKQFRKMPVTKEALLFNRLVDNGYNRLIIHNNEVHECLPDLIKPELKFKRMVKK